MTAKLDLIVLVLHFALESFLDLPSIAGQVDVTDCYRASKLLFGSLVT